MEQKQIASFVVRFHLAEVDGETKEKNWRIKVTHVQEDIETWFEELEDVYLYMKKLVNS
ncbi:hypothetical protein [Bacillus coreaensis]